MKNLTSPIITTSLGQFVRAGNLYYRRRKNVVVRQTELPVYISGPPLRDPSSTSSSILNVVSRAYGGPSRVPASALMLSDAKSKSKYCRLSLSSL